jgi:hypothetical protein
MTGGPKIRNARRPRRIESQERQVLNVLGRSEQSGLEHENAMAFGRELRSVAVEQMLGDGRSERAAANNDYVEWPRVGSRTARRVGIRTGASNNVLQRYRPSTSRLKWVISLPSGIIRASEPMIILLLRLALMSGRNSEPVHARENFICSVRRGIPSS